MLDEVLTKEQIAELLQCDVTTVEEKARNGELPGVKVGRSWVFPREAMLQRLNEMALAPNLKARAKSETRRERLEAEMARNLKSAGGSVVAVKRPYLQGAKQGHRPD